MLIEQPETRTRRDGAVDGISVTGFSPLGSAVDASTGPQKVESLRRHLPG